MTFPASISVGSLDGSDGFAIVGVESSDLTGYKVASAGDVNGDGFDDVIIGAYGDYYASSGRESASYVVFGTGRPWSSEFLLSSLNGSNGFKLSEANSYSGASVASAGDVNGDGYGDLIVGTSGQESGTANSAGDSYVVFGRAGGFAANLDLSTLNGANGFRLEGLDLAFSSSSATVSSAGDVNGDGLGDLLIGVTGSANGDAGGRGYIVFGTAGAVGATLDLATLAPSRGFRLDGFDPYSSLASAGDVNGDGISDFIVGSDDGSNGDGHSQVVFGRAGGGFGESVDIDSLDGTDGFTIVGASGDYSGDSVSGAGDVNGDGFDDLIVSAAGYDLGAGAAYVVFGKSGGFGATLDLGQLNDSDGFLISGGGSLGVGYAVSSAGDVNGDGFDDVMVSVHAYGSSGEAYVVFGSASPVSSFNLGTIDGTNGFKIGALPTVEVGGISVSAAGDVNGDGLADIIVGAPGAAGAAGESYVIFGRIPDGPVSTNGSNADQTIHGSDVDDWIDGAGGDDIIIPHLGNDIAYGGTGVDTLFVDYSSVVGGARNETRSVTSPGGTTISYYIDTQDSSVRYSGFEKFHLIGSVTGPNSLRGGAGDDYLRGGTGNDILKGYWDGSGAPADQGSSSNSGNDTIDIGKGRATAATTGSDTVEMGTGGDDHLIADYSASTEAVSFAWYSGYGAGVDYYSSASSVTIAGVSKLSYSGVERFTVRTGSANDVVTTGNGADVISGGGGNDTIDSGKGKDRVDGGAGLDSWASDQSSVTVAIILNLNSAGATTLGGGAVVSGIEGLGNLQTGLGNDVITTFASGGRADTVNTGAGNDTVTVYSAATSAATGSDTVNMGVGGNDHLIADYSASTQAVNFAWYSGYGAGVDYYSSASSVMIAGVSKLSYSGVERFTVRTGSANDVVTTGNGADVINGGGGNDTIDSGKAKATIDGGIGTDSWAADLSAQGASIILNLNRASSTQTLGDGSTIVRIERLGNLVTGAGNDVITTFASGALVDIVNTGAGNDTVTVYSAATSAGTGSDTVNMGTGGDDHLIADYSASTEAVSFAWYSGYGAGVDYYSSASSVMIAGVSKLSYSGAERFTVRTGSANDVVTTGNGADVISGGGGNDRIDSGKGKDRVDGGLGLDSWASDQSSVAVAIILNLNSAGATTLGGGAVVSGIEGLGNLQTGLGNDVITTFASGGRADTVNTGAGNDTVTVYSAATSAATGSDTVNMGVGGNDHLIADYSASTQAVNFAWYSGYGAGVDYYSSASSVMIAGVSKLSYSGVERFTVRTGSANDVVTTGNGADVISGGGGNDTITTAAGADILNGGTGTDRMTGGVGNDRYWVDSWTRDATRPRDTVIEAAGEGTDSVTSTVTYELTANVENLALAGVANLNGTGNALRNSISGNTAANRLDGKEGADTMAGGLGNDTYVVDTWTASTSMPDDAVVEAAGAGTDAVESSVTYVLAVNVENLALTGTAAISGTGNTGNNIVRGNTAANTLKGGGGNDKIFGGLGNDILFGEAGNDGFYFDAAGSSTNRDKIEDFNAAADSVLLKKGVFNIATVATPTATTPSAIKADAFKRIDGYDPANPTLKTVDPDSSDRIIYDQAAGKIYYDADGSGAAKAVLFATVDAGTSMSASDFLIFI